MANDPRRAHWNRRLSELARERSVVVHRQFLAASEPGDKVLLRHLDRELNYYEMQLLKPAFERLEAQARAKQKLARQIARAVTDIRKMIARDDVAEGA